MKITIEIKDDKFIWEYAIGKDERHHGEHPVSSDGLTIFTNVIHMCHKTYVNQHEEWIEKVKAGAFLERHYPDVAEKLKKEKRL